MEAPNQVFKSCLDGFLLKRRAEAGAQTGEYEKY